MKELSERIRKIIRDTKRKQIELAADAGVSKGLVSQWLKGTTASISLDAARNIARVHGYNPGWVMRGESPEKGPDSTFVAQPRSADLNRLLAELEDVESMGPQWAELAQAITALVHRLKEAQKMARLDYLTSEMRAIVESLSKIDKAGGEEREHVIGQISHILRGPKTRLPIKKEHSS
ncbi:helix-turn-helix domain-containing protein [Paraburkholderia elongata]|uniref:Helix-turn-helix domain-containing protein n=1 Tax=Paraburkholderia elongata TaxID=2675747 RepID=A0A972NWT1_9BURK|nr:helix-turn-helix domain-containing protein [Paraburkholderia elongata]NPT59060.1 helix-turn-helix domain-containing protein [Paraburkholderia elongata]